MITKQQKQIIKQTVSPLTDNNRWSIFTKNLTSSDWHSAKAWKMDGQNVSIAASDYADSPITANELKEHLYDLGLENHLQHMIIRSR